MRNSIHVRADRRRSSAAIAMFGFVQATPGQGVASTTLAVGRFADIDATTLTDTCAGRQHRFLAGPDQDEGIHRRPHPGEQDPAGRNLRLALAPGSESRGRQDRRPDALPGLRSHLHGSRRRSRVRVSSTTVATSMSSATRAASRRSSTSPRSSPRDSAGGSTSPLRETARSDPVSVRERLRASLR